MLTPSREHGTQETHGHGSFIMTEFQQAADLSHTPGTPKGEERVIHEGREPGRQTKGPNRTARDSTSINPEARGPIDPRMPQMPPA